MVMAIAWVRIRFRVVFCSNIVQFVTVYAFRIEHMWNGYGGKTSG